MKASSQMKNWNRIISTEAKQFIWNEWPIKLKIFFWEPIIQTLLLQKSMEVKKLRKSIIRYPENKWFGIMVDNGYTGSLCSVALLEAYRNYTGYSTPLRKLKNHYMISAYGGSKCISITTFKFPYGDSVIEFDAPIIEKSGIPLILGLKDMDKLNSRGADQIEKPIIFAKDL